MIFWDSSAIVPLVLSQDRSDHVRAVVERDAEMIVWWGSPVEVLSALARSERERDLTTPDAEQARRTLHRLSDRWNEVQPADEVRERAGSLLLRHPLRAADALQLGAALTWARGRPPGHAFLSLDERLVQAARGEGFELVEAG